MNATHQVLFGSAVLTVFSIIAGVIAYGTKLVLVRNLTVEEYGLFFSVLTLIFVLQIFTSLGLSSGLSRSIAKLRVHSEFSKIKSIIIGSFAIKMSMAILVMIILFVLSDWLAATYFENKQAQFLIVILSLYFPLNVLKSQFESLFNGFSKSFYLSLIQFLYNLSIFIIVIVGFY
ncbi:MAG: oligosaccharide flippase family protein [Candidatus Woesearchaeota archaeon]